MIALLLRSGKLIRLDDARDIEVTETLVLCISADGAELASYARDEVLSYSTNSDGVRMLESLVADYASEGAEDAVEEGEVKPS